MDGIGASRKYKMHENMGSPQLQSTEPQCRAENNKENHADSTQNDFTKISQVPVANRNGRICSLHFRQRITI